MHGQRDGLGAVYFLQTVGFPEVCKPKTPLTCQNIGVQRMSATGTFDLGSWAGYGSAVTYSVPAIKGVLVPEQPGGAVY